MIQVSAPGRLCLFGEHQDFLGLPVIACAIDLDIRITAIPRSDGGFDIDMPDIGEHDSFDASVEIPYVKARDYLRSATNIMRRQGLSITRGYDVTIRGTIPINAGTSSSSALTVAWVAFMFASQPHSLASTPLDIAHYAYLAEVVEFEEPGGMMDHYTSSVGGLLHIECCEPIVISRLGAHLDGFVLGESLVPKDTNGTLRQSRMETTQGLQFLAERIPGFDIRTTEMERVQQLLGQLPPQIAKRVKANFINRDLCFRAMEMLKDDSFDHAELGRMLLEHQKQLREGVEVSHPRLDALIDASMAAGALGGKLNGSGMGGCMFAYAPGRQQEVKAAIDAAGGRGHIVKVRQGVWQRLEV